MAVEGVEVVGPLPDPVQEVTTFAAASMSGTADPEGVARLLAVLTTARAARAYAAHGLEAAFA